MAVYHFTIHAYGTWRADNPRGYVHHDDGLLPPDPIIARARDAAANFDTMEFNEPIQRLLIRAAWETCRRRGWRLHAVGTDPTHIHLLVSWIEFLLWSNVFNRLKNGMSYMLGKEIGPRGRRWFVRGGSRKRVVERGHFDYLMNTYLPDHRGVFWREGQELP
jgi:REP element-mobilizing transposase RayT